MILAWKYRNLPRCVCDGMQNTATGAVRPLTTVEASRRFQDLEKFGGRTFDEDPSIVDDASGLTHEASP
jgi:hypothetical protein